MKYKDKETKRFTLQNSNGMTVEITNFGARIMTLLVPDRNGNMQDVVLGFDTIEDYFPQNHLGDFGAVIGRYANRIANGRMVVDGKEIQLPQNNGDNCLHGGPDGWQYQVFDAKHLSNTQLELTLVSPDGDNRFPGTVQAKVLYTLGEDNSLKIDYEAITDKTTVINLTNHSYFNLNGNAETDTLNHELQIDAEQYTPVLESMIPTGDKHAVEGTPFDFRSPKAIGRDIADNHPQLLIGSGYDHNWVLNSHGSLAPVCARLSSPVTGIVMELHTTAPGMQVYTGNFLDGSVTGKGGIRYQRRSAVCLETQQYPDSPNQHWPESDGYLRPGDTFRSSTIFHFTTK